MPDTYLRTLTMRSAVSVNGFGQPGPGPGSLQNLLSALMRRYRTIRQRRAEIDGKVIELRNTRNVANGTLLLHFVAYTPDDQISVVPQAGNRTAADLELIDPPRNTEFLDGEVAVLVAEDDVALCKSNLAESEFVTFVHQLSARAGYPAAQYAFALMKRADMDKLELIRREGIRHVAMNAVAHAASVEHVERGTVKQRIFGPILEELRAIAGIGDEIPEDAENLKVEVLFSFDKRRGTELDQRQLASLAETVLADEQDGFVIETLSGRKVRADEIVLSKAVRLPVFGKSVRHRDAWGALQEFYNELNQQNYIE